MNSSLCVGEESCEGRPSLLLLLPVSLSVVWVVFHLLYSSRLLALLVTKIVNLFLQDSGISIGSVYINLLARRLVFKHLHYYCRDYSIRVSSGYASLCWCSACHHNGVKWTRFMFVHLNGFEYHWYNRSEVYDEYRASKNPYGAESGVEGEEGVFWRWWKETQPSLHFSIHKGRLLLGNHHVERTLVVHFTRAEVNYSTNEASTPYDELLHSVNCSGTNIKITLEHSHGYSRPVFERPPLHEDDTDDYPLLRTDSACVVFSQDSPGLVPLGQTSPPKYALDVTLGNGTVINYGSYANRQRKELQAFFFPVDRMEQVVSRERQPGERRIHTIFDINVSASSHTEFNVVFNFEESLHRLNIGLGAQSSLSIHIPWVTTEDGSTSVIEGNLLDVHVMSSLPYRPLGNAVTISFLVDLKFPRVWNGIQRWNMKFSGTKVQANVMFAYIDFINALLDDWVGKEPNDLLDFVPVDWTIDIELTQYEIFLFTNLYNWVDVVRGGVENTRLAFCGSTGRITFAFPFTEYIPLKQLVHFTAKGQDVVVRHYAPPSLASRESLFALSTVNRYRWRVMDPPPPAAPSQAKKKETSSSHTISSSSSLQPPPSSLRSSHSEPEREQTQLLSAADRMHHVITAPVIADAPPHTSQSPIHSEPAQPVSAAPTPGATENVMEQGLQDKERFPMGYRDVTLYENGWLDLACGPEVSIEIEYCSSHHDPQTGKGTPLLANTLSVDIDVPVVLLRVFGCLARDLLGLKQNYPGEYICMSAFNSNIPSEMDTSPAHPSKVPLKDVASPEPYQEPDQPPQRTIDIFVSFKLRKITAEFPVDLDKNYLKTFPLPTLCTEVLSVHVQYLASETKVALHVDPLSVHVPSIMHATPSSPTGDFDLGHVVINGIDFNCNGFTEYFCEERVEYAWLMQLLVGRITGAVSPSQLLIALDWFYTAFIHASSLGDAVKVSPNGEPICPRVEPISENIKYQLLSIDIAEADVHICERESMARIQSSGFDLQLCTLHSNQETLGLSLQLHALTVTGFVSDPQEPSRLLQVGLFDINSIQGNLALREPGDCVPQRQLHFLKNADKRTQRLWFLWRRDSAARCGCWGDCFFLDGYLQPRALTKCSESAVYGTQFASFPSVPRQLGLQRVKETLLTSHISHLDCLQIVHAGLLDHYHQRYSSVTKLPSFSLSSYIQQKDSRSSKMSVSDVSFVSARSSFSSITAGDKEFFSVNDNLISSEVNTEPPSLKSKHRKKPSPLSVGVNGAGMDASIEEETVPLLCEYQGLVGSHQLHTATLKIPYDSYTESSSGDQTPPATATNIRIHHRHSVSDTSFMTFPDNHQAPPRVSSPHFKVHIPYLVPLSHGVVPVVSQKEPQDRRQRRQYFPAEEDGEESAELAKVSLSISIQSGNTLLFSPPLLDFITSVTKSAEAFFDGRSAVSILNWTGHSAMAVVVDSLTHFVPGQSFNTSGHTTPILHLNIHLAPSAFLALQFLQASAAIENQKSKTGEFNVIPAHKSLLTLYASDLSANILFKTSTEVQHVSCVPVQQQKTEEQQTPSNQVKVSNIKVSAEVKCPVVQADVCILVTEPNGKSDGLPGLVPAQQQLDFALSAPSSNEDQQLHFIMCDLLEAGIKEASVLCCASIVQSQISEGIILTWDNVQTTASKNPLAPSNNPGLVNQDEKKSHQVAMSVFLPVVWSQLATPKLGLPDFHSCGLDLLTIKDAIAAWQDPAENLIHSLKGLSKTKAAREKKVLLTVISNAAKLHPQGKGFNPVLSELSSLSRNTVLFSCLHQIWNSLTVFSEIHVPSSLDPVDYDTKLVAVMLALASRIYSLRDKKMDPCFPLRPNSPAIQLRDPDQSSEVTVGYVSISPAPSDLAIPNRVYLSRELVDEEADFAPLFAQVTYTTFALLRESLVPFFSAAEIPLEQQLYVPHLSKADVSLDFTLKLHEATVFALEHLRGLQAPVLATVTTPSPVLLVEQIVLNGCFKHDSKLESASAVQLAPLLPFPSKSAPPPQAKVSISSNCCIAADTICATMNTPLLKLAKHLSVTGRLRRKASKQARLDAIDRMETPLPPALSAPPISLQAGHVSKFAASIVDRFLHIEAKSRPSFSPHSDILQQSQSSATNIRVLDYLGSPRPPKHKSNLFSEQHPVPGIPVNQTPTGEYAYRPPKLQRQDSSDSSPENQRIEDGTSPEEVPSTMDTYGEDTTDSQRIVSSDEAPPSSPRFPFERPTTHPQQYPTNQSADPSTDPRPHHHTQSETLRSLVIPKCNLLYSIFGLLKLSTVKCELQFESTRAVLELAGISAAVDTRNVATAPSAATADGNLSILSQALPTYLSVAATLRKTLLRVLDRGLPENDVLQLVLLPMYASIGLNNCIPFTPTYRGLLKLTSLQVEMKQSAVKVHKRFQQNMPAYTKLYHEIFGKEVEAIPESAVSDAASNYSLLRMDSVVKLPSLLPQGFIHLSLDKTLVYVAPLPSLSVTYSVSPVTVTAQTLQLLSFQLMIGEHVLRFNPKEQHKDELSLRSLTLPHLFLQGKVKVSAKQKLPQVSLDLSIKPMNIDLSTDVLNQLLIVQNTFIKELNDLLQMLTSIGEYIPHRERLPSVRQGTVAEEGISFISCLQSCRLSLAGIIITISTPLATAIRFTTSKIDFTVSNASSQPGGQWESLPASAKNQLSLDGKVEIDINLALGYLQHVGPDVVDDLCELAYFQTRIAIRNTLQKLAGSGEGEDEEAMPVDTFLISILSPHLYLQSSAVEQAILFWLNCKSVYSYWQNERKQLNVEIRRATEAFIEKIPRPTQFHTPSIDFSTPRLVQISVSDVGACMPIIPMSHSEHLAKKQFPALVVTIKEMQFLLNLSHKVASTGRFQAFCIRFAEQFSLRHKIWTIDSKKHKFTNFGTITRGTFRLCIATKKRLSEKEPTVPVGERLQCAFQWDMSGINVQANTDIGHHTSTLVRTMTTIASDLEGQSKYKTRTKSAMNLSPKIQQTRFTRKSASTTKVGHRRPHHHRPSQADANYKVALEQELARQTRKVQHLRFSGASGDTIKTEEASLRSTESELAKTVQRMFRNPRSRVSLQKINQIFNPWPASTRERAPSTPFHHKLSTTVRMRLFSLSEETQQEPVDTKASTYSTLPRASKSSILSDHKRYTSEDLTELTMVPTVRPSSPSPSLGTIRGKDKEEELEEEGEEQEVVMEEEEELEEQSAQDKDSEPEGFVLPSLDLQFDITINVDHGKVVLMTEESSSSRLPIFIAHASLLQSARNKPEHKHMVESVLLIPALTVKAHYQSIVGPSYSASPSPYHPSSPSRLEVTPSIRPSAAFIGHEQAQTGSLPVKRGVLSLSTVIESLPEDIKLTPSFLEFIEQVARPTLAATVVSSSSSSESLSDEATDAPETHSSQSSPISFPVDVILTFHIRPSTVYLTCQPHSQVECIIQSPDVNFVISFSLFSHQTLDGHAAILDSHSGSIISQAVPFNNLYITGCLTTFLLQLYSPQVASIKGGLTTRENKEALSLTVGQALLHFSRKSVLGAVVQKGSKLIKSVDDYETHNKMQVSVITNVASLVLGYDMRRLNDITAFRRCWYRTSLVEALFIGSKKQPEEDIPVTVKSPDGQEETIGNFFSIDNSISAAIVVAASIDDFRISANFAQVMGNADLLVTHLKFEAHCDISHNELVLLQLDGNLEKGEFDARSGVIAGSILVQDLGFDVLTQSQQGSTPVHRGNASLALVEGKVDYMSSCIVLGQATQLKVEGSDHWEGLHLDGQQWTQSDSKLANIRVTASFTWEEMQVAIHRSTTQHMFNIVERMYNFIMQQKRRSERTLNKVLPAGSAASKALQAHRKKTAEKESTVKEDTRHHWLWAIKVGSIELMSILGIQPPKSAHHEVSLGGKISVSGETLCIVCFHGTSFRESERVVFSIDQVKASFSTQAIPGLKRWKAEVAEHHLMHSDIRTCQQIVELRLGSDESKDRCTDLATIHRVSAGRSRVPNISSSSIREWLAYACIDSYLHESKYVSDNSTLVRLSRKLSIQPVLLVPALQVELINDHFWPVEDHPTAPRVECTLTSSFSEGISVTTTVDHYLFLHDVIKGYVDYLAKHRISSTNLPSSESTESSSSSSSCSVDDVQQLGRVFECVCWELDPHLYLMTTVSGQFNPHISWLLEKLGFKDARTTIPKWVQRGAMDPLDKGVATAVEFLVKLTANKKKNILQQASSVLQASP